MLRVIKNAWIKPLDGPAYEIEVIKLHVLDLDFGLELRFEKWRWQKIQEL